MNRKRLAIIAGIVILVSALMLMLWPDNQIDNHTDEEVAETELPEGLVLIDEAQIRNAEIELGTVETGAAVVSYFPRPLPQARARARGSMPGPRASCAAWARRLATMSARARPSPGLKALMQQHWRSQLSAARARVTELSAAYDQERRLFEANVTARQDLEAARANLDVARSELNRSQAAVAAAGVSGDGRSLAVTSRFQAA